MSTELIKKMSEILSEHEVPERHSFFQIEKFIIGKEPTAQSQLWQILRELKSRQETVESILDDLEKSDDTMELFDIKIERADRQIRELSKEEKPYTDLDIKELEIHIRKIQRDKKDLIKSIENARKRIKYVFEESKYLISGYEQILKIVGKVKSIDDDAAQSELWNEKLLEKFNLSILLNNPIDSELVRTILVLDDNAPVKKHVLGILHQAQQKMIAEMKGDKSNFLNQAKTEPKVKG